MDIKKNDLSEILNKDGAKIYFVGIGGIAMSAAAGIAKSFGFGVTGSDSREVYAPAKAVLEQEKISCSLGYNADNIKNSQADVFIISAGEDLSNPEVKYIRENHLPNFSFPELLFELSKDNLRIVVTGTHGKSTTAGLVGHIAKNLDNSSFMAGGVLRNYESNFFRGDGHYFVFEGDEYKSLFDDPTPKFHYYKPDILVLTNLEFDHPDIFENLESLEKEFSLLIEAMPEDGLIVYNADDANLAKLVHKSNVASVSFGIENEADFKAEGMEFDFDYTTIQVSNKHSSNLTAKLLGQPESYKIQLPGKINVYNALAAIATFRTLGFSREQIALDLLSYLGVKRRFEVVGAKNGVTLIDDYAHHPTAVKETLKAAKLRYFSSPDRGGAATSGGRSAGRLWAVFEPHTFSRTKATLEDLSKAFVDADEVLVSKIYPAREKANKGTITSEDVIKEIKKYTPPPGIRALHSQDNVRTVRDKNEALGILKNEAKPGDVIIVMAVGDFNRLAYELKDLL